MALKLQRKRKANFRAWWAKNKHTAHPSPSFHTPAYKRRHGLPPYGPLVIGTGGLGTVISLPVELRDGGVLDFGREHAVGWHDDNGLHEFKHTPKQGKEQWMPAEPEVPTVPDENLTVTLKKGEVIITPDTAKKVADFSPLETTGVHTLAELDHVNFGRVYAICMMDWTHKRVAEFITTLGFPTTESSVRRYRKKIAA